MDVNWLSAAAASGVIAHLLLWATWKWGRGGPVQIMTINAATFLFLYFFAPIRVAPGDAAQVQQWFTMCAASQIVWTILDLLLAPQVERWAARRR